MRDFAVHRATPRNTRALHEPIFERFLDVSLDAIVITDERGFVHWANPQMEKLLGWTSSELVGRSFDVLLPEELRLVHAPHRADYVNAPTPRELVALHKNGAHVPVAMGLSAVRFGEHTWVMATMREDGEGIVERERALFETILDGAGNPIIYIDAATGRLRVNPQTEKLLGHAIAPRAGRAQYVDQLRFPDGRRIPFDELGATRALRGETVTWQELLVVRPDGSEVPVLESAAPVIVAPDVTGVVVVFQDITVIKELARVREEWIAVIAHDLRQPITVITGYVKLLARMMGPTSTQVGRFFGHITTSAQQLNRMVEDLLDISRIEAHRLSLERRPVDLPALVRSVVDRSAELTRDHAVRVDVRGAIPFVDADPGRVEQVLCNLLSNAAKYGEPGSLIAVAIERFANNARVAVENRGRGIPEEDVHDLFKRFFRARAARGGRVTGIGLGLYIAKALVEAHGGTIDVESIPDETTTFRFTLPLRSS
jgi:PAS domain S-box-containing protein